MKYFTKNDDGEFVEVEIDDAAELKKSLKESREDTKKTKARLKELEDLKAKIEAEKAEVEQAKLADEKKFEELWQAEKTAKEEATSSLSSELEKLKTTLANNKRESLANELVTTYITKDVSKAKLAAKEALQFIKFEEDQTKIIGKDGASMDGESLAKTLKEQYPFLADGVDSSGGGARGGTTSQHKSAPKTSKEALQQAWADK